MNHAKRLAAIEAQLADATEARGCASKVLSDLLESKAERFSSEGLTNIDVAALAPVDVLALVFAGYDSSELRERTASLSATPGPVGKLFAGSQQFFEGNTE